MKQGKAPVFPKDRCYIRQSIESKLPKNDKNKAEKTTATSLCRVRHNHFCNSFHPRSLFTGKRLIQNYQIKNAGLKPNTPIY